MVIKSQNDFFSGLLMFGVGLAFASGASSYKLGDAARMGPGYFPLLVSVLLMVLGVIIVLRSLVIGKSHGGNVRHWAWRPLLFIIGANLIFGALLGGLPGMGLPAMGMVLAIYALTFIASFARGDFNLRAVCVLATLLSVFSYLIFIVLLRLPILVWPAFIKG